MQPLTKTVVLLPVFEPRTDWLAEQLESIASQTVDDLTCIVSHDGQPDRSLADELQGLLPDERFRLICGVSRLGTYRHFESLIREYGLRHEYFALCDQDDIWLPNRLTIQLAQMADPVVSAVSVNGVIVDSELRQMHAHTTFSWFGVSEENVRFRSTLNQITGASVLCRSVALEGCVPFPMNLGSAVHDHWIYLVATANGTVSFVEEPLWLYRQHDGNQIGAAAKGVRAIRLVRGMVKLLRVIYDSLPGRVDPVIEQGREFLRVLYERWPAAAIECDALALRRDLGDRLLMLRPTTVIQSRLESMRLALLPNDS